MSRRSHRKSRTGCMSCKQRHIRCDETLPVCANCRMADRPCSFTGQVTFGHLAQTYPTPATTTNSPEESTACPETPLALTGQQFVVNVEHLDLFCHFCTDVFADFYPKVTSAQSAFDNFWRHTSSVPFVVHEILAISALHLSFVRPAERDYFRNYAKGLQTQALSLFNNTNPPVNETNSTSSLVFCSLIGIHVLCDSLRYREGDLNSFLDRFTQFFRIHRGVRVAAGDSWNSLRRSELGIYLETSERVASAATPGAECETLSRMLLEADISLKSMETYRSTITSLQAAFDMDRSAQTAAESRQLLFAWTILAPPEYIDLLAQRRPEALIILAFYGVILHRHRDLWLVGDGGEFLIKSIGETLGGCWEEWLDWPRTIIGQVVR